MSRKKRIVNGNFFNFKLLNFRVVFNAYRDGSQRHIVKKDKFLNCSCKEGNFGCVPCQHEIALCAIKLKDPNLLYFAERWQIKYFNFQEQKDQEIEGNTSNKVKFDSNFFNNIR